MSDTNLWLRTFIILIIVTVGFIITSFGAGDESIREFSKNVAIILIPIVAGGITTKFTTNAWQVTKEKFAIRQNILEDYTNSYKKMSILQDNFVFLVIEKYIRFTDDGSGKELKLYSRPKHEIHAYLPKIIESPELPKTLCKIEFEKLQNDLREASILQNKLFSKIRLHFDNDDPLLKEMRELKGLINEQGIIIQRYMESKDVSELEKFFDMYNNTVDNIEKKFRDVEKMMIEQKFREISL